MPCLLSIKRKTKLAELARSLAIYFLPAFDRAPAHSHSSPAPALLTLVSLAYVIVSPGSRRSTGPLRLVYGWFCDRVLGSNDRRPPFYVLVRARFGVDEEQASAEDSFNRRLKARLQSGGTGQQPPSTPTEDEEQRCLIGAASIETMEGGRASHEQSSSSSSSSSSEWDYEIEDFKWEKQAEAGQQGEEEAEKSGPRVESCSREIVGLSNYEIVESSPLSFPR